MKWHPFSSFPSGTPIQILLRSWRPVAGAFPESKEGPELIVAAGVHDGENLRRAYAAADFVVFSLDEGDGALSLELGEVAVLRGGSGLIVVLAENAGAELKAAVERLSETWTFPIEESLHAALQHAADELAGKPAREKGLAVVPLYLRECPHFMSWFRSQEEAGNELKSISPRLAFRVGPRGRIVLFWAAKVDIYVTSEGRSKSNEIVFSRPDIYHLVAWCPGAETGEEIVLVREFRSPARTKDGFIRETPGGSAAKGESPQSAAVREFLTETDFDVSAKEIEFVGSRQVAGTTSSHHAHVFSVKLEREEMEKLKVEAAKAQAKGEVEESERTYIEVVTISQLLESESTDWATMGMILTARHP